MPRPVNRSTPARYGLTYKRVVLHGHGDAAIEAWITASSRSKGSVLMFHGYAEAKDSLLPMARVFHEAGYGLMLVDFYGSGGSSRSDTSIGYYEAEDVAAAFHGASRIPLERPLVLYGVSMGSSAILRSVALNSINPDALILESPFDRLLTTVKHRFEELNAPSFPGAHLLTFWGGAEMGFDAFGYNPVKYAGAVRAPTLIMIGDRDQYVRIAEAQAILKNIPCDNALVTFPGVRHESCFLADRERWKSTVADFLATHVSGDRRPEPRERRFASSPMLY
jgi:alpha-beta hydrolase superfamily lysophospholipase